MKSDIEDTALLQAILEAAVDAIIVADASGMIQRVNPAACRMFQYRQPELLGKDLNTLVPGALARQQDHATLQDHPDTADQRIIGIGRDLEGRSADGSVFPAHLSMGHADVGGNRMFVAILHDLTLRNATKDALARSQRLDAIGKMTGGIAHDFNNLMTVIIGNLELLEQRTDSEVNLPLIRDALASADLGADLTSRLMVFARRSNLKPERIDLRVLCEKTLAILRRTLGSSITIKTDYAPELADVMIDPVQLQSALMNLALNARDAMGARGNLMISIANITIDDHYMAQETDIKPGDYVRLSISDDGAGMTEEAQQRAFEPFFTTKAHIGGTGFGLSMVYGFVRQSGGHITLYSELGLGTSFGLYFPAVAGTAKPAAPAAKRAAPEQAPVAIASRYKVLVVEDNPRVRKLSAERIRDLGYATEETATADEAYRLLKGGLKVDIVFSDLVMPGKLNGYDLAALVSEEFPQLKVLLTSGYASDVLTDGRPKHQRYHVLHKPYHQSDLAGRLHALLTEEADGLIN